MSNVDQGISNEEGLLLIINFCIHNSLFDVLRFIASSLRIQLASPETGIVELWNTGYGKPG
jgi:hypothetical protein